MPSSTLTQPYDEQPDTRDGWLDSALMRGQSWLAHGMAPLRRRRLMRFAIEVEQLGRTISDLSDMALLEASKDLRARLLRTSQAREGAVRAFALAREASARQLGLRHYAVQIMGGAAMLGHQIAEMETGEGKTITAMLPASYFALRGWPVHIVTVNDYLADRDCQQLGPVYGALGLSVGLVTHTKLPDERRAAYAADITYCTNKELVFDYLRDRLSSGRLRGRTRQMIRALTDGPAPDQSAGVRPLLLRGLHAAIVDEADSVLIDEARTPLLIAARDDHDDDGTLYAEALDMVRALTPGEHWQVDQREHSVALTPDGRAALAVLAAKKKGLWIARRAREELAERALSALALFQRDTQYIVAEGKVHIVDEFTGRTMPDRSWEHGLHQMVEVKEGLEITGRRVTLARITYQRFFRRYRHLTGMTGTAMEVAGELAGVYRLGVMRIPTNRPSQRRNAGRHLFANEADKWIAVVRTVRENVAGGRSVLIGTRSVEISEHVSTMLTDAALPHVILNARQDRQEADIVAAAGQPGRITVATNMAGRGTDIRLSHAVRDAGGLHVVLTEHHASKRIDRQLSGRGGRQGDPGGYECFAALDDEVLKRFAPAVLTRAARQLSASCGNSIHGSLAWFLVRRAQHVAGRQNERIRRETLANDTQRDDLLAFAGESE